MFFIIIADVETCTIALGFEAWPDMSQKQGGIADVDMTVHHENGNPRLRSFFQNRFPIVFLNRGKDDGIDLIHDKTADILNLTFLIHIAVTIEHFIAFLL